MTAPSRQQYSRPYLDALAWIDVLEGTPDGVEIIAPILGAVDAGKLTLVVSAVMPLELLGGSADDRTREAEERALAALSRPHVVVVPVGRAVVLQARRLRLDHGLKSMDALHLASALRGNADVYFTRDTKVLRIGQERDTRITVPYWFGDVPLPGLDE